MRDSHLTPVLEAASEAELALLIEFLGRPPSGLLWLDRRVRGSGASAQERVAAVVEQVLRCGDHSIKGRLGAGNRSYLQLVCDALQYLEVPDTPGEGVLALELRVVRHVLDSEFERLAPELQNELLASFYSGEFFARGIHGYDLVHPFLTRVDPEHRTVRAGKVGRALRKVGANQLQKRAAAFAKKQALRLVLRGLAGPVNWLWTAWDWAGPAYRLTIPVICYVAYLRGKQAREDQARAAS
jgi:uncharacterized protein YaaW (UPF0174 family)